MPYIPAIRRPNLDRHIKKLLDSMGFVVSANCYPKVNDQAGKEASKLAQKIQDGGDLNYALSCLVLGLFYKRRKYDTAEYLMGALTKTASALEQIKSSCPTLDLFEAIFYSIASNGLYAVTNRAFATVECVKFEFYTRHARLYEDTKIANPENGDILWVTEYVRKSENP